MIHQAYRNNLINDVAKAYGPIITLYLFWELYFRYEHYSGIIHNLRVCPHQQKKGMYCFCYIFLECVLVSLEEEGGEAIRARGL